MIVFVLKYLFVFLMDKEVVELGWVGGTFMFFLDEVYV